MEGWGWFDALYMTAITITTVGFLEVHPMGAGGRVFTMALALGGVFTAFYAAAEFIRALVTGEIGTILGRQRMETRLEKLDGHFVVCGFGRMGRLVAEEFSSAGLPFVVVDRDEKVLVGFDIPHGIPLVGDATADDVLRRAGVERARALVTAAASDADNVFITMSARLLNERLVIVARAEGEGAEVKLRRAGASRVVSPYSIGGHRVAQAVLRPNAMDFIELATRTGHLELQIEEVEVRAAERPRRPLGQGQPHPQRARDHHRRHQEAAGQDGLQPRARGRPRGRRSPHHPRPPPAARPPGGDGDRSLSAAYGAGGRWRPAVRR